MSEIIHEFLDQPLVLFKNYVDKQNSAQTLQIIVSTSCLVDSGNGVPRATFRISSLLPLEAQMAHLRGRPRSPAKLCSRH